MAVPCSAGADDRGGDEAAADADEGDDRQRAVPEPLLDVGVEGERDEEERVDEVPKTSATAIAVGRSGTASPTPIRIRPIIT